MQSLRPESNPARAKEVQNYRTWLPGNVLVPVPRKTLVPVPMNIEHRYSEALCIAAPVPGSAAIK